MTTPGELERVEAFRNRLVAFVLAAVERGGRDPEAEAALAQEQAALSQEYGRIARIIAPYGAAAMVQFNMVVSQDVIRDTIQRLDHLRYDAMAKMAIGQLDWVIGQLRADVEDAAANGLSPETLYRLTSPLYWVGRLGAFVGWVIGTNRGRIVGLVSLLVVAIVSGIVSGVAQGWYEQIFK